jgi:hypothetical protein
VTWPDLLQYEEFGLDKRWHGWRGGRCVRSDLGTWHVEGDLLCVTTADHVDHRRVVYRGDSDGVILLAEISAWHLDADTLHRVRIVRQSREIMSGLLG